MSEETDKQRYIENQINFEIEYIRSWPTKAMAFFIAINFGIISAVIALQKVNPPFHLSYRTKAILVIMVVIIMIWMLYILWNSNRNYIRCRILQIDLQEKLFNEADRTEFRLPKIWFEKKKGWKLCAIFRRWFHMDVEKGCSWCKHPGWLFYVFVVIIVTSLVIAGIFSIGYVQQKTTVTRIIDGDTIQVLYGGMKKRIRLIGIDTPESRVNKKAKNDAKRSGQDVETIIAMGKRATEYVGSLVNTGDTITIEIDVQEMDRYGRLLGYVYLSNGKMLNEEIVKAGYAHVMTIPPNVKYKDKFLKIYQEARESKRGLWKE
jgi:micrococcal nuclease